MAPSTSRRPRPGLLACACLGLGITFAIAAPASALAGTVVPVSATCTTGGVTTPVSFYFHATPTYDPLFNVGDGTVLTPFYVTADGTVVLDRLSGIGSSAVTLSTCTFTVRNVDYVVIGHFSAAS